MKTGDKFPEDRSEKMDEKSQKTKKKKGSSLLAATTARSATAQVSRHDTSGLANTGTNISYEGATAPGAGGSVGRGYASGKEAVGETLRTNSDYEQNRAGVSSKRKNNRHGDSDEKKPGRFGEDQVRK
jgi:hypothetical protein